MLVTTRIYTVSLAKCDYTELLLFAAKADDIPGDRFDSSSRNNASYSAG